ncbi:hypothetical protein FOCC_FOCC012087 [Frankliniella occidentalis]|uniref:Uncharacterized protein LOC113208814 n=1 Tax=Frankliniella occidentalis TaxID=133901 RepID=A0A6J1SM14_FRAOC|nr:uncharacterized protein LOC113208814 [Frankliniella occidentalis]KAE8742400.1 hypothetical protein FOCC_FOCC012087 [Frankliniella occidentalis]
MGGSQSTRNISVVNENEDNVIKVSDGVVRRLFGDESAGSPTGTQESLQPAAAVAAQPAYIPGYNPISTAQVRREVLAAKDESDKYWTKRISSLVDAQERSKKYSEAEYEKALNEVKTIFKTHNTVHYESPCKEIEGSLTKCYNENPSKPLNCAAQVQAFSDCVQVKHTNRSKART